MNSYRTGYIEHVPASDWTNGQSYDSGPHWHRTAADTEYAIDLVVRCGSTVTRVTR